MLNLDKYKNGTIIIVNDSFDELRKNKELIYLFENDKIRCLKLMKETIGENVIVLNCALGDTNMEHYIGENKSNIVVKLDGFSISDVKLIVINYKNYEIKVLKGATKTIIRNTPDIFINCDVENITKIEKYVTKLGYRYSGIKYMEYFVFEAKR